MALQNKTTMMRAINMNEPCVRLSACIVITDVRCRRMNTIARLYRRTVRGHQRRERMVAKDGIEPPTQGFSILCSTN